MESFHFHRVERREMSQQVIYARPGETVLIPAQIREQQYFGPISCLSCIGLAVFFGPFGLLVCCCPCDRRREQLVEGTQMVVGEDGSLQQVSYGPGVVQAQRMEPMMREQRVVNNVARGEPVRPEGTNEHYYPKV